jgi:hypothetical protein
MAFIGNQPTAVPLTSSQLADGLITTAKLAADAVTSAKIADGAIVNVDVNSTAALAYSKLNLATSIVNGDIANATIALAKLSATGTPSASTFLRGDNSWASAGAAAGQVIQVLSATDQTDRVTTSQSFVTASNTLAVTITPSSSSNKIFVITSGVVNSEGNSNGTATIFRDATNIGNGSAGMILTRGGDLGIISALCMSKLDSPNTTSAITYQVYIKTAVSAEMILNKNTVQGSLTCFEIKG